MSRRGSSGVMPKTRPLPAHARDAAKPHLIYYCYQQDCGIGEAATDYQRLLRELGWDVEVRPWRRDFDDLYRDAEAVKIHHWHPQPEDQELMKGRRKPPGINIAYWATEVQEHVPPEMEAAARLFDEIWTPSEFCAVEFRMRLPLAPVKVLPHVVAEGQRNRRPNHARRFHCAFWYDSWSRAARKNPGAAMRVFRRAFPRDRYRECALTIKVHHATRRELEWLRCEAAGDERIKIVSEFLGSERYEELWEDSDCLLSLQRGEGFGLNIAKAMARGIPVVTTGWGGHMDYARAHVMAVPFQIEDVAAMGDGWYHSGVWAEPDEEAAVMLLKAAKAGRGDGYLAGASAVISERFSRVAIKLRLMDLLEDVRPGVEQRQVI